MILNERSEKNLVGVHPTLVSIVRRAASYLPRDAVFVVTEGLRTFERQKSLYEAGKSKTMNSRHLKGYAVDIYPGSWNLKDFRPAAEAMKRAAEDFNVEIEWGGDWKTFIDAPHFELSRKQYP